MAGGEGGGRQRVQHVLVCEGVVGLEHDGGVREKQHGRRRATG
jgi:hypothetical protein